MSVTGDPDRPATMAGPAVSDYIGGLMGTYGVFSALYYKQKTGLGQWVDKSMFEASAFTLAFRIPHYTRLGIMAGRKAARGSGPLTRSFPAKDGAGRGRALITTCCFFWQSVIHCNTRGGLAGWQIGRFQG